VTWRAHDSKENKPVILKLAPHSSISKSLQLRLQHEVSVLSSVQDPRAAFPIFLGIQDEWLSLARPYVQGKNAEDWLKQQSRLSFRETLSLATQVLLGLEQAHRLGALHRHITPPNVIIDGENGNLNTATLVDFGLSVDETFSEFTRYMSPEQAGLFEHGIDERSDLYSVGVLLFECLTGRPLISGDGLSEILRKILLLKVPSIRAYGVEIPQALDDVIARLLAKDPRDRYQSAQAALWDISAISKNESPNLVIGLHDRRDHLTEALFVGREKEMDSLERAQALTEGGNRCLVFIEAESGGGKSRLITEWLRRSRGRENAWILRGQGSSQSGRRPLEIFHGVIEQVIDHLREQPELGPKLRDQLGTYAETICSIFPGLAQPLQVQTLQEEGPEALGENRALEAFCVFFDLLDNYCGPIWLILDDFHWADEFASKLIETWYQKKFLGYSRQTNPSSSNSLLLVAFRSAEARENPELAAFLKLTPTFHLKLSPLSYSEVQALAESMAGKLPSEAITLIETLSGGNPFLASSLLQGLVERGSLWFVPNEGWRIDTRTLGDIQASEIAADVTLGRLTRLPTPTRGRAAHRFGK
jgi:hypothetical protein